MLKYIRDVISEMPNLCKLWKKYAAYCKSSLKVHKSLIIEHKINLHHKRATKLKYNIFAFT